MQLPTTQLSTQLRGSAIRLPSGGRAAHPVARARGALVVKSEESMSDAYARIREARKRSADERNGIKPKPKRKGLSVLGALDFQEDIAADQGLLAKARRLRKGDKMSRDEYNAVQRKVVGTKGGFFGEQVELKSKYEQLGYVKGDGTSDSKTGSIVGAGVALVGVLATLVALSGM